MVQDGIQEKIIHCRFDAPAAVQHFFGFADLATQFFAVRGQGFFDQYFHFSVFRDVLRNRNKLMFDFLDRTVLKGQFERAEERAVRTGLDDCRFADLDNVFLTVMGVAAQADRHSLDFAHQFQILRKTEMGQNDDQVDCLFLQFRHIAGQLRPA
ncbi:hypothetical protein SDC9_122358 [bioreactor metagenome]|uniref:Uncharacterized protein n=1 Tax=bioreactor metagenome TaxID=1076179 RepID=A0A645CEH2_9ZZZZ